MLSGSVVTTILQVTEAALGSEKAAWFEGPDGNVLCLHEPLPSASPDP